MANMFTEEKIQGLFGSLAAEDESVDRLSYRVWGRRLKIMGLCKKNP